MKLTQKQEKFTRNLFSGMSQYDAYREAGYAVKATRATLDANASRLANNDKIIAQLEWLNKEADDKTIATVKERKQILTEIARGNLLDYQEVGADGSYLNIDKNSPNSRAISEITTRTEYNKDESSAAVVTRVKMHNPVPALDLLNKMEKIYSDSTVNIDKRTLVLVGELTDEQLASIAGKDNSASGSKRITEETKSP